MSRRKLNIKICINPSKQHGLPNPIEPIIEHFRYTFRNVPPQPNYLTVKFDFTTYLAYKTNVTTHPKLYISLSRGISLITFISHIYYTLQSVNHKLSKVKINRVFFPRRYHLARSLNRSFTGFSIKTVRISLFHSCASLIRRRGIWLP